MTPAARYLASLALTCVLLAGLYAAAFVYQLGAPVAAEYWVPEAEVVKLYAAERRPGRRLLILGGSNTLFGLDSSMIERETHLTTTNLGVHGGLSLPYILDHARPLLRRGDVVLLSLEYGYYESPNPNPSWFASNIMAWDPEYFWRLDAVDKITFALSTSARRILAGVVARIYRARLERAHGRVLPSPETIRDEARAIWRGAGSQDGSVRYSLRNIDEHGDIRNSLGASYASNPAPFRVPRFTYSAAPWRLLRRFRDECAAGGVRLFITWPALPEGLGQPAAVQRYLADVQRQAAWLGIPILGEPSDSWLPQRYFLDTVYHLNADGRTIRTARLLAQLKGRL
jgi:hypothetical protein